MSNVINNIKELIETSAKKYGDNVAFKLKKENVLNVHTNGTLTINGDFSSISYKEFKYDIDCLGTALCSLGLKGKRIAVISSNRYEWCVSYMATVTGTGIVVPLDRALPDNEIESSIIRSKVEVVLFENKHKEIMEKLKEQGNTSVKYFVNFDLMSDTENILSFDKLLKQGANEIKNGNVEFLNAEIENEIMSIMLFTSGTTATSKVVMLSHKNLVSNIMSLNKILKIYETDLALSFLPIHHALESIVFLVLMSNGASIAFCDGLRYIAQNLKEYKISAMVCVPLLYENMYKKMLKTIKDSGKENTVKVISKISNFLLKFKIDIRKIVFKEIHNSLGGNIRFFLSGAAPIDKEVARGFNTFGIRMMQGYGLTEASPVIAMESDYHNRVGSTGVAIPELELKIDAPDEKGIGEIIVRGPNVMLGYYEDQQTTHEVLKDGWFHTGDLGYVDQDGYVFITGRKKNVIVMKNGKNIYPEELEALIGKNLYITESIVYGKPHKNADLLLGVKIVYNKELVKEELGDISKEEIEVMMKEYIKQINKMMPAYKTIKEVIITDEPFIKTTTQKIKRYEEIKGF